MFSLVDLCGSSVNLVAFSLLCNKCNCSCCTLFLKVVNPFTKKKTQYEEGWI